MVEYRCYKDSQLYIKKCDNWEDALKLAAGDYHRGDSYPISIKDWQRELVGQELKEMIIEYHGEMYG